MKKAAFCATAAALLTIGGVFGAARPASAWKPKTHVYLAEQALKDAIDNGKVTIYETDYKTGKIIGVLGEFDVDPKILAALKAAPKQFRAGVLGPDAYPDILTGQQEIHPDAALAWVNGGPSGSDAWLSYLWNRGFENSSSPQVQAFTIGYLTHAAGDVFAHTFVNHFSGGEFMLIPNPTNAIKHLVLEGYLGKRTPQTLSAFTTRTRVGGTVGNQNKRDDINKYNPKGGDSGDAEGGDDSKVTYKDINLPITQEDTSIDGVQDFIYNEMTFAQPGSILEQKLLHGDSTKYSIPFLFSALRNGLQKEVNDYDRIRLSKTGPDRLAYAATNGPGAEYKRAWIKDIDDGLKAWPATSHELAKALVYNENGADLDRAKEVAGKYLREHLISMRGVPDGIIATVGFINDVINAILPQFLIDALHEIKSDLLNWVAQGITGKTLDEWGQYLKNPEVVFDNVLNQPGGGHDGDVEHAVTLAAFNRDYLKINDGGYQNPGLKWDINQLPPAFNTLQMCKILLLGETGTRQLANALHAKGADCGDLPKPFRNAMLGWVHSLDHGNQWQGFAGQQGGPSPRPFFAENNGAAFQKLFLPQVGEKPWINTNTHDATPVPPHDATPVPTTGNTPPPAAGTPATPAPVPVTPAHVVTPDPVPVTPTPAPAPAATEFVGNGEYQSLTDFDVRLDKIKPGRPGTLEVFVSMMNKGTRTNRIIGGGFDLWLFDTDGVGWLSTQNAYRASGDVPGSSETWDVEPGDEVKVRYVFRVPGGWRSLSRLRMQDRTQNEKQPIFFDLQNFLPKSGQTTGGTLPPGLTPIDSSGAWKDLENWDIRMDGMKRRGEQTEVFFTIKNTKNEPVRFSAVRSTLTDTDGVSVLSQGNFFRASGDSREHLDETLTVEPGREMHLSMRFAPTGTTPKRLIMEINGGGKQTWDFALSRP